ncbi:MAG: hypothetical protein OEW32_16435 [Nitrospira sp.]|nr:hypothetical protein [Nitrospira sp.]
MNSSDLTKVILGSKEDQVLTDIADRRMATFDRKTAKTHAEVWGTSKRSKR